MVIGGLMSDQTTNNAMTKLPFLGDLPLVGAAFRSSNKSKNERELIIFLTPHIIDDADQSALKGDNVVNLSPGSFGYARCTQTARQEINNSLNSYEMN